MNDLAIANAAAMSSLILVRTNLGIRQVQSHKVYWGRERACTTNQAHHVFDPGDANKIRNTKPPSMDIKAIVASHERDVRIDLFRGIANWFLFLDHIPNNVASWITVKNFGFSGAADLFIFISGYAASIVYARMMLERGFVVGATRLFKRARQLYIAYVVLFVIYIVTITDFAARYFAPDIIYEFNVSGLVDHPIGTLAHGLLLESRPLNLDILQLLIILMAVFAPLLWVMLRKPDLAMAGSIALYFAARTFQWNLPSFPGGSWNFNPFCWQLLFVSGAWFALGGTTRCRAIFKSPSLLYFGIAYLIFALVMTMAGRFPEFGKMLPTWLFDAFNPNDKTNLAPYRVLHFIVIAFIVARLVSKDWRGLEWQIFQPIIKCGEQSLAYSASGSSSPLPDISS
jgi:hypothetical protein